MGVTIGALLVRKLSKAAERLTPRGMAAGVGDGLRDLGEAIRDFSADVREAMHEREAELRADAGFDGELGNSPSA